MCPRTALLLAGILGMYGCAMVGPQSITAGVPAPVGAVVVNPPAQVTNVYVNDENLGYSNGAYYKQEPPVGATVETLPKDAKETTITYSGSE